MLLLHNTPEYANALKNAYRQFPAKDSTLDIDFIHNRQRVAGLYSTALNGVTFTRSTTGTYFDATGTMQTSAINAARFDYDPILLKPLGLLIEESRANILLNSDTGATQSVTVSATAYTLSFWGTGTVTLSGVSTAGPLVGTGANTRVTLTFTPTAGTLTLTVSGTVTKWQIEAGSFATSYISTGGTAATRGADVAGMLGSNFSSWYSQNGGTILVEYMLLGLREQQTMYHFGKSATDNRLAVRNESSLAVAKCITNNVTVADIATYTLQSGVVMRHAYSAFGNDFAAAGNGVIGFDNSGQLPTLDYVSPGSAFGANAFLNGYLRRITFIPKRLPNNLLQYLARLTA